MNSFSEFWLWLAVIFPLVFSAGPGNVLCAVAGAAGGFRNALPFVFGLDVVYSSYSLLAGFGMAAVLLANPAALTFVQATGALYVFWLGIRFFARRNVSAKESRPRLGFWDGAVSQALNVKGATIILAMYSQFLDADRPIVAEVLTLTAALAILNLFTHMTWAYGGAWIARTFASEKAVRAQGIVFGAMLVCISLWLGWRALSPHN